jgi:hypothetical protein
MTRPPKNHHRELVELAALFTAAGLTDLFTDLLGHRIEGPSILLSLGAIVVVVTFARHRPIRRGRAPSAPGPPPRAADRTQPTCRRPARSRCALTPAAGPSRRVVRPNR